MKIVTTSTFALGAALLISLASTAPSFAKGHDQGFGAGAAGPDTAGKVDDGQSNRNGMGSETSYGKTDASIEAKEGTQDVSDQARDKSDSGHPSNR